MSWDVTSPAGSSPAALGDDNIRELKTDLQTALRADDTSGVEAVFPGTDPASPVYRYRGLKGSTAARPVSGDYGLYFDTTRNVLQRDNGTAWEDIASLFTVPVGGMMDFAGAAAPTDWLLCDGAAVSRTTYANLFIVIGTTYGNGDAATTFNLPDTRRRVTVGKGGTGTATLAATVGSTGGEEDHTLTTAEMPAHGHAVTDPGHFHTNRSSGSGLGFPIANADGSGAGFNSQSAVTGITLANAGGGGAHNNLQPSLVVCKIIKF